MSAGGGSDLKRTLMSSAMCEPSTEYTLAAPAVRAKKDGMRRLLHYQLQQALRSTRKFHAHAGASADIEHCFAPKVARIHRHWPLRYKVAAGCMRVFPYLHCGKCRCGQNPEACSAAPRVANSICTIILQSAKPCEFVTFFPRLSCI